MHFRSLKDLPSTPRLFPLVILDFVPPQMESV